MPVNAQWLPRGGGAPQAVAAARLSCTARARAPPLPIVLHDGERAGVRGRCGRRWCGRSLRGGGPPQRPHTPRPLTLTLSPRREERRGERGARRHAHASHVGPAGGRRASPAQPTAPADPHPATPRAAPPLADLTPSAARYLAPRARAPSSHRPSRWGEGRGEGPMRAPAVRPIAPQRWPAPTPSRAPAPHPSPLPTA